MTTPLEPAATIRFSFESAVNISLIVGEFTILQLTNFSPRIIIPLSPKTQASPFESIIAAL